MNSNKLKLILNILSGHLLPNKPVADIDLRMAALSVIMLVEENRPGYRYYFKDTKKNEVEIHFIEISTQKVAAEFVIDYDEHGCISFDINKVNPSKHSTLLCGNSVEAGGSVRHILEML